MNKKALAFATGAAGLALFPVSSHAAELLIDGSFESPVVAAGTTQTPNPGLGTLPTNWTIFNASGVATPSVSNLTHGVVTNGTGNTGSNNLPLDPFDPGSAQSLDISGAGSASHLFTAQYNTPVTVKIDFGGRDSGSASGSGSYWTIYNNTTNALVASSSATPVKPAFGGWSTSTLTTAVSLAASTQYRFVVTLDNLDQVDGVTVTQVPEPNALAAAGLGAGLLGWLGFKRRRRA